LALDARDDVVEDVEFRVEVLDLLVYDPRGLGVDGRCDVS
jgi:hypothetical protein